MVGETKLPFGNFPRLILAWLCTEAVRTQSRELVLGRSLAKFMRDVERFVNSPIAESGEYWWNPRRPERPLFKTKDNLVFA